MLPKILIIGLIVILLIGLVGIFSSCHRRPSFCKFYGSPEKKTKWIQKKISKELNLNENQKVELKRITDEILTKRQEFKGSHAEIFNAMLAQVQSDAMDQEKLNQLFEDKELEFKEMRFFLISKVAEFHNILTPEQRQKLAAKMEKFHSKWHQ